MSGQETGDFSKSLRFRAGLTLIIVGHATLVLALVLPSIGLVSSVVGGFLAVAGESLSLASIAFLGMQGFKLIKSKVFRFASSVFESPVGRARHALGIGLFLSSILANYVIMLYGWAAFRSATPQEPWPVLWGLDYGQQATLVHWMAIVSEGAFLCAIYVLGARWWERFRMLFVYAEEAGSGTPNRNSPGGAVGASQQGGTIPG